MRSICTTSNGGKVGSLFCKCYVLPIIVTLSSAASSGIFAGVRRMRGNNAILEALVTKSPLLQDLSPRLD